MKLTRVVFNQNSLALECTTDTGGRKGRGIAFSVLPDQPLPSRVDGLLTNDIKTELNKHIAKHHTSNIIKEHNAKTKKIKERDVEREKFRADNKCFTYKEFFNGFTQDEWKAIKLAATTDDDIQYLLDRFGAVGRVKIKDSTTVNGVNALVSINLMAQADADKILGV